MRSEVERAFQGGGGVDPYSIADPTLSATSRRRKKGVEANIVQKLMERRREANQQPMAKWELNRLAKKVDREELEALASQRSLEAGGEGGRIEVYAGGAMEWVPNGPGGVPQPTTGDVFFDPIADEQRKIETEHALSKLRGKNLEETIRLLKGSKRLQKFAGISISEQARGGTVKKFQAGGLAQVTGPPDEEEEGFDVAQATGVDQILESVGPSPGPDLYKMAAMNRDTAIQQLRAGQAEFSERRDRQNKRAEQDRWLAMAQAMLSPTKTGGFGENVGMAAGALRAQSAQQMEVEALHAAEEQRFAEREMEVAGDYFDALTNLEGFKNNSRARVVGSITVVDPSQAAAVKSGEMREEDADRVWANAIMEPSGRVITSIASDPDGNPYRVVDPKKDPQQAAAQTSAEASAKEAVNVQFTYAKEGLTVLPMVRRYQRAYQRLSELKEDTSGLNEKIRSFAVFAGISELIDDNTTLAQLHSMFGRAVLQDLRLLTGSKTDFEYQQIEKMNASLTKSVPENLAIIDEQLQVLNRKIDKGEHAAQKITEGPGIESRDFMLEEYLRYRKEQAEAAVQYDAKTREAPVSKLNELMEAVQQNEGNLEEQSYHIESFREFYDIPEEIALELRKAGAGI